MSVLIICTPELLVHVLERGFFLKFLKRNKMMINDIQCILLVQHSRGVGN